MELSGWNKRCTPFHDRVAHAIGSCNPARALDYQKDLVETCRVGTDGTAWPEVDDIGMDLTIAVGQFAAIGSEAFVRLNGLCLILAEVQ